MIQVFNINEHSFYGLIDLDKFARERNISAKRQIEIEGKNFLLNHLIKVTHNLVYDENGKPFLKDDKRHISLSHSHGKLVIIINSAEATGIDIELIRDKVLKIRHKFLWGSELTNAGMNVEKLLVYWAAKETLFKIEGVPGVNFTSDLKVHDFIYSEGGGTVTGEIILPQYKKTYILQYLKTENYILVYPK